MSKWANLRCVRVGRDPDKFKFEPKDALQAKEWVEQFRYYGARKLDRFIGMLAEIAFEVNLREFGFQYEHKTPKDFDSEIKCDFRLKAKDGRIIGIETKSCSHLDKFIIIQGDKFECDYLIGIKISKTRPAVICGYMYQFEVISDYPVYEVGEHRAITHNRGRPIPLRDLHKMGELWEILNSECGVR